MNTKQEEFDAVVKHLYKQGYPAKTGSSCAYRGEDGTMCAVGCRIPDESYSKEFEGSHVYGLLSYAKKNDVQLPPEIGQYFDMFDKLQIIHDAWDEYADGAYSFDDIAPSLKELASKEGITYNAPGNAA